MPNVGTVWAEMRPFRIIAIDGRSIASILIKLAMARWAETCRRKIPTASNRLAVYRGLLRAANRNPRYRRNLRRAPHLVVTVVGKLKHVGRNETGGYLETSGVPLWVVVVGGPENGVEANRAGV